MATAVVYSTQATIAGVNYDTREVTLEVPNKPGDNFFDVAISDDVKNLSQIRFGDRVTVEYVEAVFVDLYRAGEVDPGVGFAAAVGTAPPHERPARAVAKDVSVVAVIEAIDRENELVTLRGPQGMTKVVKARNPANLDKVKVGDKIKITFARALAVSVTPSPVR
jgi:Cu/Ag efflux protein CusF